MLIIGNREVDNSTVSVRLRTEEDLGSMDLAQLIYRVKEVIDQKQGL